MLDIEYSYPNEESCYRSKINLKCRGVQIYIDNKAKDNNMSSETSDE